MKTLQNILENAWHILTSSVNPAWILLVLPLFVLIPLDSYTLLHWHFAEGSPAHKVAQFISDNGDFYKATAALVVIFFVLGLVIKNKRLRLLAIAMLLSCAIAGIVSLAIRIPAGRPRPSLLVADGLYGPQFKPHKGGFLFFDYDYQAFPSGHATTAVATAVPALVIAPAIGVPLAVAAVGVMWARFQLDRHRISDLYMGLLIGAFFGVVLGRAAKKELP